MLVARYAGPVWVTLGLVLYYYASILNVLRVKNRLGREYRARNETFDRYLSNDRQMLTADRVQLNTLEQMPPFLILLWLDASLVNPQHATIAGVIYLTARFVLPVRARAPGRRRRPLAPHAADVHRLRRHRVLLGRARARDPAWASGLICDTAR